MVLWVLRCRNAHEYHQLISSLSLPSDGFMSLAVRNTYEHHQLFSSLSLPSDDFLGLAVTQCL